jgi:starvation-inducible DNA-binding protein
VKNRNENHILELQIKIKNSIELLSTTLADAMTCTLKNKKISLECYWRKFMEMHKFFENQYKQLDVR